MTIITDPTYLAQRSISCVPSIETSIAVISMRLHVNKGCGLAAIQVGIPLRIIMLSTKQAQLTVLNPELKFVGKATRTSREGCLSIPGKIVAKVRHYQVILTGFDEQWNPIKRKLKGFDAFVAQHEVDHLNGITI